MSFRFEDRKAAGRYLAAKLSAYSGRDDVVVLALPRGGVPVGREIADALHVPLDVFLVRKLGVPHHEELAFGALASGGVRVFNEDILRELHITDKMIDKVAAAEEAELRRREMEYRRDRPALPLAGKTILLVDDGLATGATARAAVRALRWRNPALIVLAVPVGAASICADLAGEADEVVCGLRPDDLESVGSWYEHFDQITDGEVSALLS